MLAPGLKTLVEAIDNREDFKSYMTSYTVSWNMSGNRGPRREGPSEDVFVSLDYCSSQRVLILICTDSSDEHCQTTPITT